MNIIDKNVVQIQNDIINLRRKIGMIEHAEINPNLKFSIKDAILIDRQLTFMKGYLECLIERCIENNWNIPNE